MTCQYGCNDKRHVLNKETGAWQKCMCLLIQERNNLCRQARIPEEYWDLTVSSLNGFTPEGKLLKNRMLKFKDEFPKNVKFWGPVPNIKLGTYLMLKSQLLFRRGLFCSLDEVTTWFLTQDKKMFNVCRDIPVLALFFGDEYTQQVHKYVLQHLIVYRAEHRFSTIWSTILPADSGMQSNYGFSLSQQVPGEWVNLPTGELV